MGCGTSRIEESSFVTLCRSRRYSIRAAVNHRFAVAESHQKYMASLSEIGDTICRFVGAAVTLRPTIVLTPDSKSSDGSCTSLSHDLSSDSVSEPLVKSSSHSHDDNLSAFDSVVPGMAYENPPVVWDFFNGYNYGNDYGKGQPEFVFSTPPPPQPSPPPPPPPPDGSAWDFFNPFGPFENYVPDYFGVGYEKPRSSIKSSSSSSNLSEVRRREGIPELEEVVEDADSNAVREDAKNNDFGKGASSATEHKVNIVENKVELEEDGKGKKIIVEEEASVMLEKDGSNDVGKAVGKQSKDFSEVAKEMKEIFELEMACGEEVLGMLEVGKMKYKSKNRIYRAFSSRILHPIRLPTLSSAVCIKVSNFSTKHKLRKKQNPLTSRNRVGMKSGNLSVTLEKLYAWEKKLYGEIKGEEKLRIIYDRKYRRLRNLDIQGAESQKVASVLASIHRLEMKLDIVIRSIYTISRRMHMIRDKELHPQLIELIKGLMAMWKSMLDCHEKQLQALADCITESLTLKLGSDTTNIIRELEFKFVKWCSNFDNLITTLKSFVRCLNDWSLDWLPKHETSTSDGISPFSPSSMEAPNVFVTLNDWNNALSRVNECTVMAAIHNLAVDVRNIWERLEEEERLRRKAEYLSRDYSRRRNSLQHDNVHRGDDVPMLESFRKRFDEEKSEHKEIVREVEEVTLNSLRSGLVKLFEALVEFSTEMVKAYEGIRIRYEDRAA